MCGLNNTMLQKFLVVLAFLAFVMSLIFAYLNTAAVRTLYYSSNGFVDNKYYQEISPVGTAFGIVWPIIYLWNAVAITYVAISLCLSPQNSPVNVEPTLIPITFLVPYILTFGTTVGWLFAFDRELLILAFFLLLLCVVSIYFAIAISYKRVHDNLKVLDTKETKVMLWLVRILLQNGLCLPATWLTIATCLNLTDVILYQDSLGLFMNATISNARTAIAITRVSGDETAALNSIINGSTGVLTLLFVIIIVWFVLDNFVLEKYTRYTFTVFPVFILGLSGLVAKLRYRTLLGSNRNLTYVSVILAFTVAFFLIRVGLFIYRLKSRRKTSQADKVPMDEKA